MMDGIEWLLVPFLVEVLILAYVVLHWNDREEPVRGSNVQRARERR